MRAVSVVIGETYLAKVSNNLVPVKVLTVDDKGRYTVRNLKTNRETVFKTAGKLRRKLTPEMVAIYLA